MSKLVFLIPALLVACVPIFAREPVTVTPSPPAKSVAAEKPVRARDLGVPFEGDPGPLNAITDVAGVQVGYTTIIRGEGKLEVGKGPVRTGVTAIIPRGSETMNDPVYAGYFSLNGNGEMTGTAWVEESGFLEGPVLLTNTHSVGVVRDAAIAWRVNHGTPDVTGYWWSLPVVAETWDGFLNDTNGFHVTREDVFHALETAHSGPIEEGSVGGGTGMVCYEFKGGNGTASRKVQIKGEKEKGPTSYTVGVFVQANMGRRPNLMIAGIPVGKEIPEHAAYHEDTGSIIIVIATDAPLLPNQLKRLARRGTLGLARTGAYSGNGSGDLFIAFSTANPHVADPAMTTHSVRTIPNDLLDPIFEAVVQATEEAIVNALVDNHDMIGVDNHHAYALPHDRLKVLLKKYNR